MTTIRTTVRVGSDGNVVVPVGPDEAGTEVDVTIAPAKRMTQEEYRQILQRARGSIDDPTFVRPPPWDVRKPEPLE